VFDPTGPVLGIDPGLSRCGYGAVTGRGSDGRAVSYGVIRTEAGLELPERLGRLQAELEDLVAELRPSALVVERVLFQVNVRTAMSVGQASGLALALAARAGIPVAQYSPNEVKLAVAGYGGAEKAAVQAMVVRLLNLAEPPKPPDAADALALALCHLWGAPLRGATGTAASTGRYEAAVQAALAKEGSGT
jgi:crossover junction endodeoxyribonuclease RuvC